MNRPLLIVHLVIPYVLALNGYFIIIYPKYMTDVGVTLIYQYSSTLILFLTMFLLIYMIILAVIISISYGFIQRKTDEIESNDIIVEDQQQIVEIVRDFPPYVNDSCELSSSEFPVLPDVPVIESRDFGNDDIVETTAEEPLLCYCDGSYSNQMKIAYSGFRASNRFSNIRICPIRQGNSGSTESEVFAACLALQYTAKCHQNLMILHTDNSKVEQLFKSPKSTDYSNYPDFFNALNQCRQTEHYVEVQVKRVRGHTTQYEQQQCSIKRNFAIVDRQVRRKLRQHIRRNYSSYKLIHYFSSFHSKNARNVYTVDADTIFMMNSLPKILSYF